MIPFVICVLFFWTALNFTDYVFKTCMLYPYVNMLDRSGMSLKLLRAQFYFTRFNRVVHQMGRKKPRFLYWWFTVGTVASIGCIVPAVWVLAKTASGMIRSAATGTQEVQVLEPSLPGVNLPLSDIFYYIATLIVCSIFHEFGHALAAVRENVRIQGCGLFVLGIFPGAFVDLPKDQLSVLSPWRQLKIYCAGVWHNIVAALLALLLLFGNKFLLAPFYAENSGVSVISVLKESGAHGPGGLLPGDHIIGVDSCDVRSMDSWKACLVQTLLLPQHGYCQKKNVVESEGTWSPKDCCHGQSNNSLCFAYMEHGERKNVCLPARRTLQMSIRYCNSSCARDEYCLKPILDNGTKLVEVKRANWQTMLFLGPPSELWHSVSVIKWVPRQLYLSVLPVHIYEVFLHYMLSFSGALALLNVVPCIALDGQWITQGLVKLLVQSMPWLRSSRKGVYLFIVLGGTVLLASNVVLGVWKLFGPR
ncbi:membrane-bound transcription factor site-2 protease isoform X1 [Dermacentor albipictus]|uniref:membrane-bound transcription factor site-2 protease isoform X1 n=1 Tax=Dermacentor albipictus TaxID=60249 RepID=UPI0031FDE3CF